MNFVLLSMRQANREWFTDHDARMVEMQGDLVDRQILGIAPRRMVANAGKLKAPRSLVLDAVDQAISDQDGADKQAESTN